MSALGLWGVPAPDPGDAARVADSDRPSSAWAPQLSLRGTLSQDAGNASRAAAQLFTGTFAELISLRETWTAQPAFTVDSVTYLVSSIEAWTAAPLEPSFWAEKVGALETWSAAPAVGGQWADLIGTVESWFGIDTSLGQGIGDYRESIGAAEAWDGLPGGKFTYSERAAVLESWSFSAGGPTVIPPFIQVGRDFIRTSKRRRFGEGSKR